MPAQGALMNRIEHVVQDHSYEELVLSFLRQFDQIRKLTIGAPQAHLVDQAALLNLFQPVEQIKVGYRKQRK